MLELKKVTRCKEEEKAHICLPCYACIPNPAPCIPDLYHCIPDDIYCEPYIIGPCDPTIIVAPCSPDLVAPL